MVLHRHIVRTVFVGLALCIIGLGYWYTHHSAQTCEGIALYNPTRDKQFLLKLFSDNWYWLVPHGLSFSAEKFLDRGTKKSAGETEEDSKIFVYCVQNKPVGFVAYHKELFYKGRLRFIAIDKDHRGRGYSEKLMNFAMDDMKNMGLRLVQLVTRTNNEPAKKLYNKLGFYDFWHDDQYVRFEKSLDAGAEAQTRVA